MLARLFFLSYRSWLAAGCFSAGIRAAFYLMCLVSVFFVQGVHAQSLSFANHREIKIPEYAFLRVGPFYSDVVFMQSVGCRYTTGSGAGVDFLFANQRGVIKQDGVDYPLITTLQFKNYLLLTKHMDVDFSASIVSEQYPRDTQESRVYLDLAEEGVFGNLTSQIELSPLLKLFLYDKIIYKTDYVDTRGFVDEQGGSEYEYFRNTIGMKLDWLMDPARNLHFGASREDNLPRDEDFDFQEYTEYSGNFAYEQMVSAFMAAGVSAGTVYSLYPVTNRNDTLLHHTALSGNASITRWTRGTASVGYSMGTILSDSGKTGLAEDIEYDAVTGGIRMETQLSRDTVHSLGYFRSQRGGFVGGFELVDAMQYAFGWKGDFTSFMFSSKAEFVDPREAANAYDDWANSITISHELARYLTISMMSMYTMRWNKGLEEVDADTEPEWNNDYDTWLSRVGTSVGITEELDLRVYLQHVERISDAPELSYNRSMFEMMLVYRHEF